MSGLPRVLLVSGLRTVGGEERTVLDLARGLSARGWPVTVACDGKGAGAPAMRRGCGDVVDIGLRGKMSFSAVARLRHLIAARRPDIVHCHGSYGGILGSAATIGYDVAKLWTVQLHPAWNNPRLFHSALGRYPYALAFKLAARRMDETIFVSRALAEEFISFIAEPGLRCSIVWNGVDVTAFRHGPGRRERARDRLGLSDTTLAVGAVARLTHRKGIDTFIDAIAQLKGMNLVGFVAGGGDIAPFAARASALGVGERLQFLGAVENIAEFISAIDIGVLPSRGEGLPLSVMEMLAGSVPVVLSDIPAHREFLVAGAACTLVPVGDARGFARAIRETASRRAVTDIGSAARAAAGRYFSLSRMLDQYIERYETVAPQKMDTRAHPRKLQAGA